MEGAPDPTVLHPVSGQERVVFLKPLVTDPRIEVGDYTYYDDPDDALAFEEKAFLYAHGPERLIIGRYCALAAGVRFVMPARTTRCSGRRASRSGSSASRGRSGRWTS